MKKFSWILLSTALLAACGTATTSGSTRAAQGVSSGSSFSYAGANAGSNVNGNSDVNRVNPLIGKAGNHQVPPTQAVPLAPAAAPAPAVIQDRCNGGIGNPPAVGNRGAPVLAGKRPQLPACMPE